MIFGSWNVKTLLQAGKLQELADQIENTSINILAVQETRWPGTGCIKKPKYTFYYSGPDKRTGQAGTGFFVTNVIHKNIISFMPITERMCSLRIQGKYNKISLLNVYAPTNEQTDENKEIFYEQLQRSLDQIPKSDILIILGDFNAKLGKEETFSKITGSYTLHEETNQNGEMLCNFADINDLIVMSTQFCHKSIHLGTWTSPDLKVINQIDHVLVQRKKKRIIEDVRVMRGINIDSDHYLLKIIAHQKIPPINTAKSQFKTQDRWNIEDLQSPEKAKQYKHSLHEKLQDRKEFDEVNDNWEDLKNKIYEAANETIGKSNQKKKRNDWWDEECQDAIAKKNEARKKILQANTRRNYEHYQEERLKANRICRKKKKKWLNEKIITMNENYRKNETRKFFGEVGKKKINQGNLIMCKDENGKLLTQEEQALERWKTFFQNTFNAAGEVTKYNIQQNQPSEHEEGVFEPSFNEICHIINKLKYNKAPGTDNIPSELIRFGGRTLRKEIHKLICNIWRTHQLPSQWNESIIFPIYKKGDRFECNNYRPISLLNVVYKIFGILLNKRLTEIVEKKISDHQSGFRQNRSTIDNIFLVRQLYEKCYEYGIELHNIFIDFERAFDTVMRHQIIENLSKYNIPLKLIELIGLTLTNTKAKVRVGNLLSDEFDVKYGVKQGDPLSATLFSIIIDTILAQIDVKGNITTRLKQCLAYADDILLIARTKKALLEIFSDLKEIAKQNGLKINHQKTKYMKCKRDAHKTEDIIIDQVPYQEVCCFTYLGSKINGTNTIEEEIRERISAGNRAYFANIEFFKSSLLSKRAKLRLYEANIRPITTYASETWTLKENDMQRLMIFERRIMRRIFGPVKNSDGTYRIRYNAEINDLIKSKTIVNHIKSLRLSWFGHLYRMNDDRALKKIYNWCPLTSRKRGRPKIRWSDDVISDLKKLGIRNWLAKIQDRKSWKAIVEKAKTFNWECCSA